MSDIMSFIPEGLNLELLAAGSSKGTAAYQVASMGLGGSSISAGTDALNIAAPNAPMIGGGQGFSIA